MPSDAPLDETATPPGDGPDSGADGPEEADAAERHALARDLFENPTRWQLWPAVALLRWLLRHQAGQQYRRLIYRSLPSLAFQANEVQSVSLGADSFDVTVTAPGIASPGSPLPLSDIARIVADRRRPGRGGALSAWLDGLTDLFMQIAEDALAQHNAAFALATGGGVHAVWQADCLAGHSAPLRALPGHRLDGDPGAEAEGAVALAAFFVGAPSAHGLAALINAFTGIPARVEEFTGGRVRNLRPATIGAPLMRIMGPYCGMPSAGVEVYLEGGGSERARLWAEDPERCASLRLLCERYLGAAGVAVSIFLEVDGRNAGRATLGESILGGMTVLGESSEDMRIPLRA